MADQQITAASETYSGFVSMIKVATILGAILAGVVILLIS